MLVDDEVMDWDDPVRKHFPGFKLPDPNANALLTIRDLFCHRSGIGGHDVLWYHAPWNIDETIRRMQLLPLDYPFRAGYRYSSLPFLVAGRAIEKRTGKKWEELVRTRICEPLGMNGIRLTTKDIPKDADVAAGHCLGKGGRVEAMPRYEIEEPNPSGSLNATATDLAAWLKFHLAKGVGPDGKRRVSIKNLTETHKPHNLIPMQGTAKTQNPETVQLTYAMGWLVYDYRGKKVLSHGGMIDGFRVQITFLPDEDIGFAVLCNLHDTRLTLSLTNSLIDLYFGREKKDWNAYYRKLTGDEAAERKKSLEERDRARDAAAKPTLPAQAYAGKYVHPAYGNAVVSERDGKLKLSFHDFSSPLEHFERDTYRVTDGFFEEQLAAFDVKDGKAVGLKLGGQQFKRE
jgi:CubicO group peptidase (beta-lactamase class C family)